VYCYNYVIIAVLSSGML